MGQPQMSMDSIIMDQIGKISDKIGDIKADVAVVKTEVGHVKDDVADVRSDIKEVKDKVTGLDARMASLESEAFSIKHIKMFSTWLFSRAGIWALIPALVVINAIVKSLGFPGFDVEQILSFFKNLI